MTEEQKWAGTAALSRLFSALLADEEFMTLVEQKRGNERQRDRSSARTDSDRNGHLPSGEESS